MSEVVFTPLASLEMASRRHRSQPTRGAGSDLEPSCPIRGARRYGFGIETVRLALYQMVYVGRSVTQSGPGRCD